MHSLLKGVWLTGNSHITIFSTICRSLEVVRGLADYFVCQKLIFSMRLSYEIQFLSNAQIKVFNMAADRHGSITLIMMKLVVYL